MKRLRELVRILLNIVIPLGSIGLIVWLLPKLLRFFSPFVVGGIIALIANPLVRFLERKVRMRPICRLCWNMWGNSFRWFLCVWKS